MPGAGLEPARPVGDTVGVLAAAASGLVAIVFLLGFVRRHTYAPFVVYRLIVAALVLLIISTGVRAASF
jgi:undecaprenyl-diphosphatase